LRVVLTRRKGKSEDKREMENLAELKVRMCSISSAEFFSSPSRKAR
jgi:hypothetical protein